MLNVTKRYSYKGKFLGLDNYKYLEIFYNKKGELIKPKEQDIAIFILFLSIIGVNVFSITSIIKTINSTKAIPVMCNAIDLIKNGLDVTKFLNTTISSTTFMSLLNIYKNKF